MRAAAVERTEALVHAGRIAKILTVISFVAFLWGLLYPRPSPLIVGILIALPWIAVGAAGRSKGLIRIDQYKKDAHSSVALAVVLPGLALAQLGMRNIQVLHWMELLKVAIVMGAVLFLTAIVADAALRTKYATLPLIFIVMLIYGFGAGLQADIVLDRSTPGLYRAKVFSKRISSGRHTYYELTLRPWGPAKYGSTDSVPHDLYDSIQPGDSVCVALGQGALGVQWYTVSECR